MQAAAARVRVERDIGSVDFAAIVRPGDRVLVGQGAAEPLTLTRQLVAQKDRIGPFEIFLGPLHSDTFAAAKIAGIRFSSYGAIGRAASLSRNGRLDIVRQPYSALAEAFASGALKADVVLIQLAAPLPGRAPSFGLANDYLVAAARHARMVVAEINPDAPWTHGAEVPVDFPLHLCVQASHPQLDISPSPLTETEKQIAGHVAGLVPNRAVLQFGVGAVPDAILAGLTQHRELGIHSGLMTERALDLIECGAVTNASKTFDRRITVANILFGTPRLRAYAHDNPAIRVSPPSYTHGLSVLRRIENFTAINSAIEVDLSGRINSETADGCYLGGLGGLPDFIAGANAAEGGRAIIALPATARTGQSRIVASVATVSVEADAADMVVTEWGVAALRGCDLEERARRMIAIAAPEFREELARANRGRSA
jgi:acyl-CoA hydrolase